MELIVSYGLLVIGLAVALGVFGLIVEAVIRARPAADQQVDLFAYGMALLGVGVVAIGLGVGYGVLRGVVTEAMKIITGT